MTQKSLLMFAPASFPPKTPAALSNMKLAYTMAEAGWHVHIIARPLNTESQGRYPAETELFTHERITIHSVPRIKSRAKLAMAALKTIREVGFFSKVGLRWTYPAVQTALQLSKRIQFGAVLSRTTPLYAHLAGLLFTKATGIPWLANYADPDARPRYPKPYGEGPRARVSPGVYLLGLSVSRHAAQLTFPSRFLSEYVCSYLPNACRDKASVIPHVALTSLTAARATPIGSNKKQLTIVHVGSTKAPRDATPYLAGLNRFHSSHKGAGQLRTIFCEHNPEELREKVKDFGLQDSVVVLDPVTYGESAELLAKADIALLVEASMESGIFLPSKFADYVQARLPVFALSPKKGCVSELLDKFGGGIAADIDSPQSIADSLEAFYASWQRGELQELAVGRLPDHLGADRVANLMNDLILKVNA